MRRALQAARRIPPDALEATIGLALVAGGLWKLHSIAVAMIVVGVVLFALAVWPAKRRP